MQIKELTTDELKALIRQTVIETLAELWGDPDQGLELQDSVKQRLIQSHQHRQTGARGIPIAEVMERLGIQPNELPH
jgi:ATP-dependent Clp protease ATP-binding subunit ClpA